MKTLCMVAVAACGMVVVPDARGQEANPELQQKLAAVKESMAANQAALKQYTWTAHTVVKLKGDVKKTSDEFCRYGPDRKVQKTPLGAPAPQKEMRGVKKRVVEKKVGELTDYMERAVALIENYVPPSAANMQAAFQAGKATVGQGGPGMIELEFGDYVKPGDSLTLEFNSATKSIAKVSVRSYLDDPKDAVTLDVSFQALPDGTNHTASTVLNATAKQVEVNVQNLNYQKAAR